MQQITFYIDPTATAFTAEIKYTLSVFAMNKKFKFLLTDKVENGISIGFNNTADIVLNQLMFEHIFDYNFIENANADGLLKHENGSIDYFSTAFYYLSLAQEYKPNALGKYDRFSYQQSIQFKLATTQQNIVQLCFDSIVTSCSKLRQLNGQFGRSKIFLSHDMDTIHGSLVQDGFAALKKGRIDWMAQIILKNLFIKPHWFNVDKIMKIENEYDFKSTFYWLVNSGVSPDGIKNSDYNINSPKVISTILNIKNKGWENGIHKSANAESFTEEMNKLPLKIVGNRYHFLKFNVKNDFQKIENAGIQFDSSLGFAEDFGFRNSYGLPYQPYNFYKRKAYSFIECPLHVMDTTFQGYQKKDGNYMLEQTKKFLLQNQNNAIISVLWHNNFISDYKYKDYFITFKKMLAYFYESDFKCITQSEIIKQFLVAENGN
jgi:hypothetical protein